MVVEDKYNRKRYDEQYDGKGTKCPPKIDLLVEQLSDPGAGEGGGQIRGRVDGEDDHSVLQCGNVGDKDVDNKA